MSTSDPLDSLEREAADWSPAERKLLALSRRLGDREGAPELPVERFLGQLRAEAQRRERAQRRTLLAAAAGLLLLISLAWWVKRPGQPAQTDGAVDIAAAPDAPVPPAQPADVGSALDPARPPEHPAATRQLPDRSPAHDLSSAGDAAALPGPSSIAEPSEPSAAEIAQVSAAFERAWQRVVTELGVPPSDSPEHAAWWATQPSLRQSLDKAFAAQGLLGNAAPLRSAALARARSVAQLQRTDSVAAPQAWPLDGTAALLWLGLEGGPLGARWLTPRARGASLESPIALRALALSPAGEREVERALRDPERADAALGALSEWPRSSVGRLLSATWRTAHSEPKNWQAATLDRLAVELLDLGRPGLDALFSELDGRAPAGDLPLAAVQTALAALPERDFAALAPDLSARLSSDHDSAALGLLALSARPSALLALLNLQAFGRGPSDAIRTALESAPCAAPAVWIAAASSDLEPATAGLLLDALLERGGPAEALPPLIARTDLPMDARLWATNLVADADAEEAAQKLLAVSLALGPGQQRLAAAGLQAATRTLGLEPAMERLRAALGTQLAVSQWELLEGSLARELHPSRPMRLAQFLGPLLPLLVATDGAQ
jgi:hypothetical protein